MKRILCAAGRYLSLFLLVLALAFALEYLAGLLPQEPIRQNLLASMEQLKSEGLTPGVLYRGHPRSILDNLSENNILSFSYCMDTRRDPAAILSNPGHQTVDPYETLFEQTEEFLLENRAPDTNHVRYFMGFRMVVRPLLSVMNYMDARQCLLWAFLVLFVLAAVLLYRRTHSVLVALAFAFAVSQVNPVAITACFQYSAVFLIAFTGMLLVPVTEGRRFTTGMLFLVLGMATQIFDYYTAPVVTFGLPATVLLLDGGDPRRQTKPLLACLGLWLAGYVGTWFAKMTLTTLFTDFNALGDGLSRFLYWMRPAAADAGGTVPFLPLQAVYWNLLNILDLAPCVLEGIVLVLFAVTVTKRRGWKRAFAGYWPFLAMAALPIVWFLVAAKPSYHHAYFQYRGLVVFLFAGLLFLIDSAGWDRLFPEKRKEGA